MACRPTAAAASHTHTHPLASLTTTINTTTSPAFLISLSSPRESYQVTNNQYLNHRKSVAFYCQSGHFLPMNNNDKFKNLLPVFGSGLVPHIDTTTTTTDTQQQPLPWQKHQNHHQHLNNNNDSKDHIAHQRRRRILVIRCFLLLMVLQLPTSSCDAFLLVDTTHSRRSSYYDRSTYNNIGRSTMYYDASCTACITGTRSYLTTHNEEKEKGNQRRIHMFTPLSTSSRNGGGAGSSSSSSARTMTTRTTRTTRLYSAVLPPWPSSSSSSSSSSNNNNLDEEFKRKRRKVNEYYWKEIMNAVRAKNPQRAEYILLENALKDILEVSSSLSSSSSSSSLSNPEVEVEEDDDDSSAQTILLKLFHIVLSSWSKSNVWNAPERAEALLSRMWNLNNNITTKSTSSSQQQQQQQNNTINRNILNTIIPNLQCYQCVIECWCNSRRNDSSGGKRAELLVQQIQQLYDIGRIDFVPTTKLYSLVLNSYAKQGLAKQAELVLNQMCQNYEETSSTTTNNNTNNVVVAQPNVISFSIVLNAWSKSRSYHAPEYAENLIKRMRQLYDDSSSSDDSHHEHNKKKWINIKPNIISYTSLLDCWSKSKRSDAIEHIILWFKHIQDLYHIHGEDDCRLTTRCYTSVLNAYAQRGLANEAETLLKEMVYDYEVIGNQYAQPDVVSYSSVLNAFAKSSNNVIHNAPERADRILSEMWTRYHNQQQEQEQSGTTTTTTNNKDRRGSEWKNVKPNVFTYTSVIDCWAKSSNKIKGAERAEALLQEMQHLSSSDQQQGEGREGRNNHNRDLIPNVQTYNTVLHALAQCGLAEKAEALVKEMSKEYRTDNNRSCQPTSITYTILMTAWSKSSLPEAPNRVEEILEQMWDLYHEETENNNNSHNNQRQQGRRRRRHIKPDMTSYVCVADTWAKSRDKNAGDWAEAILREAEQLYQINHDEDFYPDIRLYNAVINCHAQGGNGKEAQEILEELLLSVETNGTGNDVKNSSNTTVMVRPDRVSFNSVLKAWSKSPSINATHHAEALLTRMKQLHHHYQHQTPQRQQQGPSGTKLVVDWDLKPTVLSYNYVIQCWAKKRTTTTTKVNNDGEDDEKEDSYVQESAVVASQAIQALLEEMLTLVTQGDPSVAPNLRTYNLVLDAIASSSTTTNSNSTSNSNHPDDLMTNDPVIMERLHHVIATMKENGVIPDNISYQIVSKFGISI